MSEIGREPTSKCKSQIVPYLQGKAPEGYEFIDEEEEYVVAPNGRSGSWQPYQPGRTAEQPVIAPQKKPAKRKQKKKAETQDPDPGDGPKDETEDI